MRTRRGDRRPARQRRNSRPLAHPAGRRPSWTRTARALPAPGRRAREPADRNQRRQRPTRLGRQLATDPELPRSGVLAIPSRTPSATATNARLDDRHADRSPESMLSWQLEYGAKIGRAATNFTGPIVFVVVSRHHGGAFVVFTKALPETIEIAAVEGSPTSSTPSTPQSALCGSGRSTGSSRPRRCGRTSSTRYTGGCRAPPVRPECYSPGVTSGLPTQLCTGVARATSVAPGSTVGGSSCP